jgi:hypothetical protein
VVKLQFAASWIRFDTSFSVSTLARFCASALNPQDHTTGLPCNICNIRWSTSTDSLVLSLRAAGAGVDDGSFGFADSDCGNSSSPRSTKGNLCLYSRSPAFWRVKMQLLLKFCTFAASRAYASPNKLLPRCTRTTQYPTSTRFCPPISATPTVRQALTAPARLQPAPAPLPTLPQPRVVTGHVLLRVGKQRQGFARRHHGSGNPDQLCAGRSDSDGPGQNGRASRSGMCTTPGPSESKPGARRAK